MSSSLWSELSFIHTYRLCQRHFWSICLGGGGLTEAGLKTLRVNRPLPFEFCPFLSLPKFNVHCDKAARVPTGTGNPGKPGKMRQLFPVREF